MKTFLIFIFGVVFVGCNSKKPENSSGVQDQPKVSREEPTVSIDSRFLEDITPFNSSTFSLSGTCSEEGEDVTVIVSTVRGRSTCANGGTWVLEIDVSALKGTSVRTSITADHSTSSGRKALQATKSVILNPTTSINTKALDVTDLNKTEEASITVDHSPASDSADPQVTTSVTNDFVCPENYVRVSSLENYTTNRFCVMKYEAKSDGSASKNAISQASGLPYVDINRDASIDKCTEIGEGYDLITNDEWQSIARNIELVSDNWSTGVIGNAGGLSHGHSDSSPDNALAASGDDTEGCSGTEQNCSHTTWDDQRRTHTLSNGEVIWDIAGNVSEWVKDNNDFDYGYGIYLSQVKLLSPSSLNSFLNGTSETSRRIKAQFGPSGDYTNLNRYPFGGLGYGFLNHDEDGVIRGGDWRFAGVFTVSAHLMPMNTSVSVGFRCVFHPFF